MRYLKVTLFCILCFLLCPSFASAVSVGDTAGDYEDGEELAPPVSVPDPVVDVLEPDVEVTEPVPQVTVTDSDEPVVVEQTEDEKRIVLNVTITPPNVDVKTESPTVTVSSPVVTVENPVSPVVELAPDSASDSPQFDDEMDVEPAVVPFSLLSLDSDFGSDSTEDTVRTVLVSLFGEYSPRTQTVTQVLSDGTEITYQEYVPGLAGLDVPWIASVVVFLLLLFCLFRLLGGVLVHG